MGRAVVFQWNTCGVAHLYDWNFVQQLILRMHLTYI